MTLRIVLFFLLLQAIQGQDERPVSAIFHQQTSKALPNAELPPQIAEKAIKGLALIADPSGKTEHGIPLYLINAGEEMVQLPSQDRDLYAKLESRNEDGTWRRAQAHGYSWCGNSYFSLSLAPGQHFKLYGYQPRAGRPAETRYTIYSAAGLSTCAFKGLVSDQDLTDASVDDLSVKAVPRALHGGFSSYPVKSPEDFERIFGGQGKREELTVSLTLWKQFGDVPRISKLADELADSLQFASEDEDKQFVEEVKALLQLPFHPEASPERLMRFCLDEIENGKSPDPGNSPVRAYYCWEALISLCLSDLVPKQDQKMIFEEALSHEQGLIFGDPKRVEEFLPTSRLWAKLGTANDSIFRLLIWDALLRRDLRDEVIATLGGKYQRDRGEVLALTLGHSEGGYHSVPSEERALWVEEFESNPIETGANIHYRLSKPVSPHPFRFLEEAARNYWLSQIRKSEALDNDFENEGPIGQWTQSLRFYSTIETKFDPEFWEKLARYRGYTVSNYSTERNGKRVDVVARDFPIRTEAARLLEEHGHDLDMKFPEKVIVSETPRKVSGK